MRGLSDGFIQKCNIQMNKGYPKITIIHAHYIVCKNVKRNMFRHFITFNRTYFYSINSAFIDLKRGYHCEVHFNYGFRTKILRAQ